MKKILLITSVLASTLSPAFAQDSLHNQLIDQISGVSGYGSINSETCKVRKPCINVYLESDKDLENIESVFPNGIKVDGVSYEFSVIGTFFAH